MTGGKCSDLVRAVLRSHESPDESFNDLKIFIDFDQAVPDEAQLQLFNLLEKLLENADEVLENLSNYKAGASAEIRLSIQNPNDEELQAKYFTVVKECVNRLHNYYALSQRIEQSVPLLLWELCSGPLPPAEQIDSCQALCKQLARLIDFSLQFDSIKMKTPSLQNDFSYYRRVVSRSAQPVDLDMISIETTNIMSLFIAKSTPMLCSITSSVIAFVQTHPDLPVSNTTDTLATVVHCAFET
uniref:CYRIA-B_Rac1-bd domain-containing protein n=1 Tax=Steinernema glaseri TaxID=37863 RepID=A0A1I7YGU9_9BILA